MPRVFTAHKPKPTAYAKPDADEERPERLSALREFAVRDVMSLLNCNRDRAAKVVDLIADTVERALVALTEEGPHRAA
jgi:hypothetical protein